MVLFVDQDMKNGGWYNMQVLKVGKRKKKNKS